MLNKLHLYAQEHKRHRAKLIGTKESLTLLRDALNRTLTGTNSFEKFETMPNDGESYTVIIRMLEDNSPAWQQLGLPYYPIRDNSND